MGFRSLRCRFDSCRGYKSGAQASLRNDRPAGKLVGVVLFQGYSHGYAKYFSPLDIELQEMTFLYIVPGMGIGSLILVGLIVGIVLLAVGYTVWARIKRIFKK